MIENFANLVKRLDEIDKKVRSKIDDVGKVAGFGLQSLPTSPITELFSQLDNIKLRMSKL